MTLTKRPSLLIGVALLAFATAFVCGTVCAQEAQAEENEINLVTLGDSFTIGYGMHGSCGEDFYETPVELAETGLDFIGYKTEASNAYPSLVKKALEEQGYTVNLSQMGQSALRSVDLRYLLDETFSGDAYTRCWYLGGEPYKLDFWVGKVDTLRAEYEEAIKNADVITLSIGQNDLATYLSYSLLFDIYDCDFEGTFGSDKLAEYKQFRSYAQIAIALVSNGKINSSTFSEYNRLVDCFAYALYGYELCIDVIINKIYELNSDVLLICPKVMNLYGDLEIEYGDSVIELGNLYGLFVEKANDYLEEEAAHCGEYYIADQLNENGTVTLLTGDYLNYSGDPTTLTQDMRDYFDAYDSTLCLTENTKLYLEANGIPLYESVLDASMVSVYDEGTKIVQYALEKGAIKFDDLASGAVDMEKEWTEFVTLYASYLRTYAIEAYATALDAAPAEPASPAQKQAVYDWMNQSETARSIACLYFKMYCAMAVISHPNIAGHQEIADAIIKTYNSIIFKNTVLEFQPIFLDVCNTYGSDFVEAFAVYAQNAYGTDSEQVTYLTLKILNATDKTAALVTLLSYLGVETVEDLEAFANGFDSFIAEYVENLPCTHKKLKVVSAVAATCCSAGHSKYYVCTECGKYYKDAQATQEIKSLSEVKIAALGHRMMYVKASVKVKTSLLGKAGNVKGCYLCTRCGYLFNSKTTKYTKTSIKLLQIKWYNKKILAYYQVKTSAGYKVYYGTLASSSLTQYQLYTKLKAYGWTKSYKSK